MHHRSSLADAACRYAYDELDRLLTADPPGTGNDSIHFGYDPGGNRTQSGYKDVAGNWTAPYKTYSYPSSGPAHRLATVVNNGGATLHAFPSYDANGNPNVWQVAGVNRTMTWDAMDRLVEITGGFAATYVYDPLGRRIAKTEQGATTLFQYDGLHIVAEYNASNVQQASYVFGPGVDEPLRVARGGTKGAFHGDGLGSVTLISHGATELASYKYDEFGVVESSSNFGNAYTYTGRERDASGLNYYRARYYLPEVGRFLTPDPAGLSGGSNPYAYVGSNPINYRDPLGLVPFSAKQTFSNAVEPIEWSAFRQLHDGATNIQNVIDAGVAQKTLAAFNILNTKTRGFSNSLLGGVSQKLYSVDKFLRNRLALI